MHRQFFIALWLLPLSAFGNEQIATITELEGAVQIFSHPGKSAEAGPSPRIKFEDKFYTYRSAQVGDRIDQGNILRTLPSAKAQVIYDNGDQLHVGSGSSYAISWKSGDQNPTIDLKYGKIRGVISKAGPRNKLQIRTRTATMGVRGTDFFISSDATGGETEVAVLRGAVAIAPSPKVDGPVLPSRSPQSEAEFTEIKPGTIAGVSKTIEKREVSKQELIAIQASSNVGDSKKMTEKPEHIVELEKRALKATVEDVKLYRPDLAKSLETQDIASADLLNKLVVKDALKDAPSDPKRSKPFRVDIRELEDGFYREFIERG